MAYIAEGKEIEDLRAEMDKRIRFLEGRISQLEDILTSMQERLRRLER
jgi:chaperonin cofactor prefoldin